MLDIAFVKPALPRTGALILPVGEGAAAERPEEAPAGSLRRAVDEAADGAVGRALQAANFKGR